jgi:hypothetical protein
MIVSIMTAVVPSRPAGSFTEVARQVSEGEIGESLMIESRTPNPTLSPQRWPGKMLLAGGLLACVAASGCQVDVGGQTLPSPYHLSDDVQYFQPGPEFKLAREAAAMKEAAQQARQEQHP